MRSAVSRGLKRLLCLWLVLSVCGILPAQAEGETFSHETLTLWSQTFCKYGKKFSRAFGRSDAELPQPDGQLLLDEDTQRLHGEVWNMSGTAAVMLDASAEDASCWRAALLYTADASEGTILAGSYALILAAIQSGFPYGTDLHDLGEMLDALFAQESIAAVKEGYVLIHQQREDGSHLLAVASTGWLDAVDADTVEKIYKLE